MSAPEPEVIDTHPRECRFAIHIPSKRSDVPDYHLIKEVLHNPDGTTTPNVRFASQYRRPFWITKKPYQNHEQKKEYEVFDKLSRHECTQSEIRFAVARALGKSWSTAGLRQLADSPYLYGSDISSTSLIKHEYKRKWPEAVTPYSVAFFDTETDVLHGTNDPIIATLLFGKKLFTCVQESFLKGYVDPVGRYNAMVDKLIGPVVEKHQLEMEFLIVPDAVALIKEVFTRVHAWSPDFLAIWNLDFDIPRILETLEKYGVDPKDIFSDPKLPPSLRFCKYKKGSTKKVTASGQVKPKNPSEQWHSLYCPAGFYVIDAMCTYRFVRQGDQEEPSYSLDAILDKELKSSKLKVEQTKDIHGLELHEVMQSTYPFEYLAYAAMDVVGMMELEQKTTDLSQSIVVQAGCTDFSRYNSQTKRFSDKYTFFLLDRDKAIGTIATLPKASADDIDADDIAEDDEEGEETIEVDEPPECSENGDLASDQVVKDVEALEKDCVMALTNWIVTLSAHMSVLGVCCVEENPLLHTLIRLFVYDSDAVGAYPSAAMAANVSRETTVREIIDIKGIEEVTFRRHNLNLLQGHVNALEYGCVMHGLPTPQKALALFDDLAA